MSDRRLCRLCHRGWTNRLPAWHRPNSEGKPIAELTPRPKREGKPIAESADRGAHDERITPRSKHGNTREALRRQRGHQVAEIQRREHGRAGTGLNEAEKRDLAGH